ncbi:hypothetical protein [Actinocorallia populi]|uniref:hypothetical protein n=1 Tax=Actinocorallia populi TaxID=2079200 RepID=UPI0013009C7B|nr:hypothetical protein [Actinocorallia populi]
MGLLALSWTLQGRGWADAVAAAAGGLLLLSGALLWSLPNRIRLQAWACGVLAAASMVLPIYAAPITKGEVAAREAARIVGDGLVMVRPLRTVDGTVDSEWRRMLAERHPMIIIGVGEYWYADCDVLEYLGPFQEGCPKEPTPFEAAYRQTALVRTAVAWLGRGGMTVGSEYSPDEIVGYLVFNQTGVDGYREISAAAYAAFSAPWIQRPGDLWLGAGYEKDQWAQRFRLLGLVTLWSFALVAAVFGARWLIVGGTAAGVAIGGWAWYLAQTGRPTADTGPWTFALWALSGVLILQVIVAGLRTNQHT